MNATILNPGDTAWVFEEHGQGLARVMHLESGHAFKWSRKWSRDVQRIPRS